MRYCDNTPAPQLITDFPKYVNTTFVLFDPGYCKVEILRNAITYIQSLEKCLGINNSSTSEDSQEHDEESPRPESTRSKSVHQDENQSVTSSSSVFRPVRSIRSSQSESNFVSITSCFLYFVSDSYCSSSTLECLNEIVDNLQQSKHNKQTRSVTQCSPSTSTRKSVP